MLWGRPSLKTWLNRCLALRVWLSCVDITLAQELSHMQSNTKKKPISRPENKSAHFLWQHWKSTSISFSEKLNFILVFNFQKPGYGSLLGSQSQSWGSKCKRPHHNALSDKLRQETVQKLSLGEFERKGMFQTPLNSITDHLQSLDRLYRVLYQQLQVVVQLFTSEPDFKRVDWWVWDFFNVTSVSRWRLIISKCLQYFSVIDIHMRKIAHSRMSMRFTKFWFIDILL